MSLVGKTVWFIETNLGGDLSLRAVASFAGVSRYHLTRAFGMATGHPVMAYVRARRLGEAAKRLAAGADNILEVAMDHGYASHEAFGRAFRGEFGATPESVRLRGDTTNLNLVEAIGMNETFVTLEEPRFEERPAFLVAGLGDRYTFATNQGIPFLWQRFVPWIGHIPGQVGGTTYGVCCNQDGAGRFDYVAGVEIGSFADLSPELQRVRIPPRRYAVFTHRDHVSTMRLTVYTIWTKYLPESGLEIADSPDFERYGEDYDAAAGIGAAEIWVPIETRAKP
jgi:AraC family transcriptional regulator